MSHLARQRPKYGPSIGSRTCGWLKMKRMVWLIFAVGLRLLEFADHWECFSQQKL